MSPHTKGKEQTPVSLKTSVEKKTKPRGRRGEREKIADKTQHKGKLNVPMNHLVDVASYWACACACQRQLTSGT